MYVMNTPQLTPLVKWAGGKRRVIGELAKRMPDHFYAMHVPFAGGLALFLAVNRPGFINDANCSLIQFYRTVSKFPYELIEWLEDLEASYNDEPDSESREKYYLAIRRAFNRGRKVIAPETSQAARFLFLNKCGFNGLFRVNKSGEYNVPWGKKERIKLVSKNSRKNLLEVSELFFRCALQCQDYEASLRHVRAGDFVYCDSPYYSKDSGFTNYDANFRDWSKEGAHIKMRDNLEKLSDKAIPIMVTNSDTPFIRELYSNWYIDAIEVPRRISAKTSGRGKHLELVITNYDPGGV